jgi:hypothetical protein
LEGEQSRSALEAPQQQPLAVEIALQRAIITVTMMETRRNSSIDLWQGRGVELLPDQARGRKPLVALRFCFLGQTQEQLLVSSWMLERIQIMKLSVKN